MPLASTTRASTKTVLPRRLPVRCAGEFASSFARSCASTTLIATGRVSSLPDRSIEAPDSTRSRASSVAGDVTRFQCAVALSVPPGMRTELPFWKKMPAPSTAMPDGVCVCSLKAVSLVRSGSTSVRLPSAKRTSPQCCGTSVKLLGPSWMISVVSPARRWTEPFDATLVVAEMRPCWLTARPTKLMSPRSAAARPPARLVTVPPPSTSTMRPRSEESVLALR